MPPFMDMNTQSQGEANEFYRDPIANSIMQYEQGYYYYRYLCSQMEYKIKCKEYEILCKNNSSSFANQNEKSHRKIE